MKQINLLFIILLFNPYSPAYSQQITYSGKNVSLKTVFSAIQKQTGYGFLYNPTLLTEAKAVNLNLQNVPLEDALAAVFKNQALEYSIESQTILVSKKKIPNKATATKSKNPLPPSAEKAVSTEPEAAAEKKASSSAIPPTIVSSPGASNDTLIVKNEKSGVTHSKPDAAEAGHQSGNIPANSPEQLNTQSGQIGSNAFKTPEEFKKTFFYRVFGPLETERMTFGFKGGINASTIYWTQTSGSKGKYGGTDLYGGFFADKRITSTFNLGTELIFSLSGSFHYLELPLHLKYKAGERWNLFAGPKLDFLSDRSYTKRFSMSGEAGSQYAISQIFFAEARYAYGFTSHIDNWFGSHISRNTFRVGIGANFTRNEAVENVSNEPEPLRLRFGLNTGAALNSEYSTVAGGDLRIQENFGASAAGTLTAGYYHYWWKPGGSLSYFPVKAGLKLFPAKRFYLSPEAGFAFGLEMEHNARPFLLAAGIGTEMKNGFDISLRYEKMTGHLNKWYFGMPDIPRPVFLALRAEYGFNLRPVGNKSDDFSEAKEPPAWRGTRKKSVFLELGGNGLEVSANFDMRFQPDRNDGPGFSAGAGITYESLSLPLVLNYIVGQRRSGIEAGIGVTGLVSKHRDENFFWYPNESNEKFMAAGVLNLGYRLQSYSGFMLRAYFTAIYDGLYYGKFFAKDGVFYPFIPGISVGYSFK